MYKNFILPIIDKIDAETDHTAVRELLHFLEEAANGEELLKELTFQKERCTDERLNVTVGGVKFDNPLIVAAGWDKFAVAIRALHTLGFAGVEAGTVTARPQIGNPKPRHFVIGPQVHLNRYGFNNIGMDAFATNLETYKNSGIPIGISLGQNKEVTLEESPEAHAKVARRLYEYGSYFVINVASPNTPGLRELQSKGPLTQIVKAVKQTMQECGGLKPLFVKIAPDLTLEAVSDVIEVVMNESIQGIIATNTTLNGDIKAQYGEQWRNEMGGLSGDNADYREMATKIIAHIYKEAGNKIDIIGAGGIKDTETAIEKIKAGAKALQIYAAFDEQGPHLPGMINRGILEHMEKNGIKSVEELVGQS